MDIHRFFEKELKDSLRFSIRSKRSAKIQSNFLTAQRDVLIGSETSTEKKIIVSKSE